MANIHHTNIWVFGIISFYCILLANNINVVTCLHQDTMLSTTIEDLYAEAILYDRHSLQLKINWSFSEILESKIDVSVKPINNVDCVKHLTCVEYGLASNTSEIILPKDPMSILEHRECSIEPGCAYEIRVETSDGQADVNITYRVPDCIELFCSCHHEKHLPNVTIKANIKDSHLYIFWNISSAYTLPDNIFVDSLWISIGKQNNTSFLVWNGGNYQIINNFTQPLLFENSNNLWYNGSTKILLTDQLQAGSQFMIRAHVLDSNGCHGYDGAFSFVPETTVNKGMKNKVGINYSWLFGILTPAIAVLLAVIVYLKRARRERQKNARKLNALNNIWRGATYRNGSSDNGVQTIAMEQNLLYIDKDILEAQYRGEVDQLELPHSCLTIGREIGKGAFGRVFLARADNICNKRGPQIVAVKQLKKKPSPEELEEFLTEISTMKSVPKHPNVVSLLGCCTMKHPFLMVMEFVGCGDLLQYLRQLRAKHEDRFTTDRTGCNANTTLNTDMRHHFQPGPFGKYLDLLHSSTSTSESSSYITQVESVKTVNLRPSVTETMYSMLSSNPDISASTCSSLEYVLDHNELHNFALQIAKGMRHLHKRQITHRDLAARNILIDENKTLKISDFGLSRSGIYVNTRNKKVPLRWLSIEAMRDNLYSSKSDVWAFGILLWEIGTLGGFPYPTITNHELLQHLSSGQRLQRPDNCSEHLYELMLNCWTETPDQRPTFSDIVSKLEPKHQKIYVDFNELSSDYVFPPTMEQLKNNH